MNAATSGGRMDIAPLIRRLTLEHHDPASVERLRRFIDQPGAMDGLAPSQTLLLAQLATAHGLFAEAEEVIRSGARRFPDNEEIAAELAAMLGDRGTSSPPPSPEDDDEACLPFRMFIRNRERLDAFLRIFRGRPDVFARQWYDAARGQGGYTPVRRAIGPEDVEDHCRGRSTYGIYLMHPDDTVAIGALDLDLRPQFRGPGLDRKAAGLVRRETREVLTALVRAAARRRLTVLVEYSGGKGYHLWFPVSGTVPAAVMRRVLAGIAEEAAASCTCYSLEVFPKQDHLRGKGLGNLIKLPLGVHRRSGKPSRIIGIPARDTDGQLDHIAAIVPTPDRRFLDLAPPAPRRARISRLETSMPPQLAALDRRCPVLSGIFATVMSGKEATFREERILFGTISHLESGRLCLHYLLRNTPSYSAPLVDYKINRVRGTVMGCRRIHRLLEAGDLNCAMPPGGGYPHPLRLLDDWNDPPEPRSERITGLSDALARLREAIIITERFLREENSQGR